MAARIVSMLTGCRSTAHPYPLGFAMLWLKAFHIIFVVTWFAGLFYLPRLFVYHVQAADKIGQDRFKVMEKKLFGIMTIGGALSVISGLWLLFGYWIGALAGQGWIHAKLLVILLLIGFHAYLFRCMKAFREDRNRHSERYYRLINEVPAIALVSIVILVVVKPF